MIKYRFAPSPTGYLHIGNARTALWNHLMAQKAGGQFILRYDDTDVERSRPEYATAILEDLNWLGIFPAEIHAQSQRIPLYDAAFEKLVAAGFIYDAYESMEELDRKRKRQQARGLPPVYDRSSLHLTAEEKAKFRAEGRIPHWRFKLSGTSVTWDDGVRGPARIETASLSDPVLRRADGSYLYTFASVVDDADMHITDILRGEDHVANTAVQIEIFKALGATPPRFAHHNLIAAADGTEMSKRTGALSLRSFREQGIDPLAVVAVAVLTGTSEAISLPKSLDALAEKIDPSKLSRALTKFDPAEIAQLSIRALHEKPYAEVADTLTTYGVSAEKAEAFWHAVRPNLTKIEDAKSWWDVVNAPLPAVMIAGEDKDLLREALTALPAAPLNETSWGTLTDALKSSTGRKGKALFMPLRLALTGMDHGPEMKFLLPVMGWEIAMERLRAHSA